MGWVLAFVGALLLFAVNGGLLVGGVLLAIGLVMVRRRYLAVREAPYLCADCGYEAHAA